MKRLYVFYDGECALCRRCREWLARQPALLELVFHSFHSGSARRICPELPRFQPSEQLVILSDEGAIYTGETAWLMCLYALRDYRGWARKLASPALRPLARRVCLLVSHNRLTLFRTLLQRVAEST
jgi:predicted DCC family thiol-disulfide oxidoreductase YuxK